MIGTKIYKSVEDLDAYSALAEWCNANGATIEDKGEYYECVAVEPYVPTTAEQIAALKSELASYDYIGIKIAMGVATIDDYADKIAYTETLREQIRALEQ